MKNLLNAILTGLLPLLAMASMALPAAAQTPARPNIVLIVSDDQGWKDVGFHGSDIATPSLDKLAAGGARLESYYAQPMCTPTRAALMSGRYPHRYGLQTLVIPSNARYGLPTDEKLLPAVLAEAGYRTAIVGKWHLGHAERKYWPLQRGFQHQYGALLGEIDYFTHTAHGVRDWYRQEKPLKETGYATELIGNEAVRWLKGQNAKQPFFLYLAFTAPHAPYQAPQRWLDRYKHIADRDRRAYAAMISSMDEQIGRVVATLEAKGLRDNTLIVFHSDNGGPRDARFTGEIDMSGSKIPADNGPWRDGKGSLYEGGVRVVALANWPGRIPAGTVVEAPLHAVDLMPTFAALAGASLAGTKPLDGLDQWAALAEGKPSARSEVVIGVEPFRAALRDGDWKLVWQATLPSRVELYDLKTDPGEKNNLAAAQPERVARMQARLQAQAQEAAPPLIFKEAMGVVQPTLFGAVATPDNAPAPR
ncbi:MAG: arylsulfatase [Burkholderiales bacterium]|nr:arylsulfatase [Burkholderiales bacterium]